jgi:hypothetical protein
MKGGLGAGCWVVVKAYTQYPAPSAFFVHRSSFRLYRFVGACQNARGLAQWLLLLSSLFATERQVLPDLTERA